MVFFWDLLGGVGYVSGAGSLSSLIITHIIVSFLAGLVYHNGYVTKRCLFYVAVLGICTFTVVSLFFKWSTCSKAEHWPVCTVYSPADPVGWFIKLCIDSDYDKHCIRYNETKDMCGKGTIEWIYFIAGRSLHMPYHVYTKYVSEATVSNPTWYVLVFMVPHWKYFMYISCWISFQLASAANAFCSTFCKIMEDRQRMRKMGVDK